MVRKQIDQIPSLPPRPVDGHKGTFGRVLLVAGSWGMTGAAILSGRGALRGGAGLVYVATPHSCLPVVAAGEPCYLTVSLPEERGGELSEQAAPLVMQKLQLMQAAGIGPGLGRSVVGDEMVLDVFVHAPVSCVIDADALNALADHPDRLGQQQAPRILTPHPGEFSRLSGRTMQQISADRVGVAIEFARQHNVVVVLKGAGTVVTDGTRYYVNTTGNSGMATGGSGDVLAGLLTAILAQGLPPFEAAQLATYLHGLAGDCAARELTQPGLIASDLPDYLPRAWAAVQ